MSAMVRVKLRKSGRLGNVLIERASCPSFRSVNSVLNCRVEYVEEEGSSQHLIGEF